MFDRDQRYLSDAEVRVFIEDEVFRVQLGNVSSTGAMLGPLGPLEKYSPLMLAHVHLRVPAQVIWHNGRQVGIQFETTLSSEHLNILRLVASARGEVWGRANYHGSRGSASTRP